MRGIHIPYHAQIIHKSGKAGTGFIVTEELGLAAAGGKSVELGKCGVLDGGAAHCIQRDVQQRVG